MKLLKAWLNISRSVVKMEKFLRAKRNYFYVMHKAALATDNMQRVFFLRALQGAKKRMIRAHEEVMNKAHNNNKNA